MDPCDVAVRDDFKGDLAGGLVFGDSKTTLVGVAFTLKDRRGESATLTGEKLRGTLFRGERAGTDFFPGENLGIASFRGESSPGNIEKRLLSRRVDLLSISSLLICTLVSAGGGSEGTSNSINGCMAATMRVGRSVLGSIGQRELCRFLGT